MPKTVIVTVASTSTPFPAGTAPAGITISLPGVAPQTITAAPYTATFTDVPAGPYVATAQQVDTAGQPLGAAATSSEFVVADDVMIDIPLSITIAVQ